MVQRSRYAAFARYLAEKSGEFRDTGDDRLTLDYSQIEALGEKLPPSAYKYLAWWYNNNYSRPWHQTGFRLAGVDLKALRVTFRYSGKFSVAGIAAGKRKRRAEKLAELQRLQHQAETSSMPFLRRSAQAQVERLRKELDMPEDRDVVLGMNEPRPPYTAQASDNAVCRHPIYGALKGLFRIPPDLDLAQPADPEWGERVWGKDAT